ncbi:hypothetical protein Tco_0692676, partial [Tanacetum coccineum]
MAAFDVCLMKMDREYKEELASKGFRYLLEKFKESDLLGAYLGVWISTV